MAGPDSTVEQLNPDTLEHVFTVEEIQALFREAGVNPEDSVNLFTSSLEDLIYLTWREFGATPAVKAMASGTGNPKVDMLVAAFFARKKVLGPPKNWEQKDFVILNDFDPRSFVSEADCTFQGPHGIELVIERVVAATLPLIAERDKDPFSRKRIYSAPSALGFESRVYGPENDRLSLMQGAVFSVATGKRQESRSASIGRNKIRDAMEGYIRPDEGAVGERVHHIFVDSHIPGIVHVAGASADMNGASAHPLQVPVFDFLPAPPGTQVPWVRFDHQAGVQRPFVIEASTPESILKSLGILPVVEQESDTEELRAARRRYHTSTRQMIEAHFFTPALQDVHNDINSALIIGSVRDGGRASKK